MRLTLGTNPVSVWIDPYPATRKTNGIQFKLFYSAVDYMN